MDNVARWFDRKFEFTFPAELFPNLCARLRGTPARLEELQQQAGHLLDLEPLWFARVEDFLSGGDQLTAADLRNQKTDDAKHNARDIKDILAEFRAVRSRLLERVASLEPAMFSRTMLHPRLKQPMRLVDHLFFAAEHDDHHLAKIWELKSQP